MADEWIRKLWYIYTMDYYSAIKKKCVVSYAMNSVRKVLYLDINKCSKRSSEQHSEKNIFYSSLVDLKHQISSKKKKKIVQYLLM